MLNYTGYDENQIVGDHSIPGRKLSLNHCITTINNIYALTSYNKDIQFEETHIVKIVTKYCRFLKQGEN